ncbi:hypothetical protein OAK06_08540 [Gammaproteobacteria bacterium]|nr:hypothetical protein [Gammaproteobacteria bacterium]
MNEEKQKKEGMFRTFWTKIEDLESAQEAASAGAIAAGYLAFSYALSLLFLYFSGEALFAELNETIPADKFEYYSQFIMYSLITVFFSFVTYRIYKQKKFGLIPFLSFWMLFEIGYKFYLVPGRGLVLSLLFTVVAINSFRGWLGIRRYQKT